MRLWPRYALVLLALLLLTATARADESVIQVMYDNPVMMKTIKTLGALSFSHKGGPSGIEHDKSELKKNYWAFFPDANLPADELKQETARFDAMWSSFQQTTTKYDVTEISFIGCDNVGLMKCLDLYFLTATPKGPLLIKYSMIFKVGDRARLYNIQTYTNWDTVKETLRTIQHTTTKTARITYEPKKAEPAEASGSKPADKL